ncbi:MAG: hypothetical protein KAH57_03570 [Thermoplasmata archaeon]|nr:hypothetical protein [Thermoplasmata archaeon]
MRRDWAVTVPILLLLLCGCIQPEDTGGNGAGDDVLTLDVSLSGTNAGSILDLSAEVVLTSVTGTIWVGEIDVDFITWEEPYNRTLDIFIECPDGEVLHIIDPYVENPVYPVELFEGETITRIVNLSDHTFGNEEFDGSDPYHFVNGSYELWAVYSSGDAWNVTGHDMMWRGSISSKKVNFFLNWSSMLKLDPVVVATGHDYSGTPNSVPYQDIHDRFAENYTGADLSVEMRDELTDRMAELAEGLGEDGEILKLAIKETYSDLSARPYRIPTYAEKACYNGEDIWALAFNRCNGFEDGIGHFDLFFVSIPVIDAIYVGGCNTTAILFVTGCD